MKPRETQIEDLIRRWREEAAKMLPWGFLQSIRRSAIEHCADELSALLREEAPQWQPIETAPKDGTWVLLGWFELPGMSHRDVGFWHSRENSWCDVHQVLHNAQSPPTHWMPLPAAPPKGGEE